MGNSSSGKGYVSKGQRPNVARKVVNLIRSERKANPPVKDILARMEYRQGVINKPRGAKQKELRDRYIEEERIELQAFKLLDQYREVGLTKAAAVQAAKTNFTERLHSKWSPILKAFQEASKGTSKTKTRSRN